MLYFMLYFFTFKGTNQMKALTNLNETLKVYNKVLHRFHEELMKVRTKNKNTVYIAHIMLYIFCQLLDPMIKS